MSDILKLVSSDNLPNVGVQLVNTKTGESIDLSPVGTVITVKMRQLGTTLVLAQLQGILLTDGTDGQFTFGFPGNALNVPAGQYEFEISVSFAGLRETVFDTLKAQIRTRF